MMSMTDGLAIQINPPTQESQKFRVSPRYGLQSCHGAHERAGAERAAAKLLEQPLREPLRH